MDSSQVYLVDLNRHSMMTLSRNELAMSNNNDIVPSANDSSVEGNKTIATHTFLFRLRKLCSTHKTPTLARFSKYGSQ